MQLTKQEIMDAQLLVCTPEKYDVVTRKGGDKSLGECCVPLNCAFESLFYMGYVYFGEMA